MQRKGIFLLILIFILAGCGGNNAAQPTAASTDPADLVKQAAANARTLKAMKLSIERTGADYIFQSSLGNVAFEHLEGQYVAPDAIQATARVMLGKLPLDVDVFAKGTAQWVRGVFSNMQWQYQAFAPDFNPQTLISQENSGLQVAMASLKDVKLVGDDQLDDGTPVYHLTATASGSDVSALVANLLQMTGQVQVDIYVDKAKTLPDKIVVVEPDTVTDTAKDPTTWTIEIYDFDVTATLTVPEATAEPTSAATAEATSSATSEATTESTSAATTEATAEATSAATMEATAEATQSS